MPENEFTGIDDETAEKIAKRAVDEGDWVTLSRLDVADDGKTGNPGLPEKTTLNAKDVR